MDNKVVEEKKQNISRNDVSTSMAFHNTGFIMVARCGNNIKVWKLIGKLKQVRRLEGHTKRIFYIVFSQRYNWFASCSWDNTILCWKQEKKGYWSNQKYYVKFANFLKLTRNEDQLLSCHYDGSITVWNVDYKNNSLELNYQLHEHKQMINYLTINQSETYLASCDNATWIILWKKNEQNRWEYVNYTVTYQLGIGVCFINDYKVFWQEQSTGVQFVFPIQKGQLQYLPLSKIKLHKQEDLHSIPTTFLWKKQLIVMSHGQYLYFLKEGDYEQLQLAYYPIDCQDKSNYGALTNNGEHIIIWNQTSGQFKLYRIQYK